jgi:hypothetical protein
VAAALLFYPLIVLFWIDMTRMQFYWLVYDCFIFV